MASDFPDFATFYRAATGFRRGQGFREEHSHDPFPWQHRLAAQVLTEGWPHELGVPTGLGKTACLDVAVWSLAAQSSLSPDQRTLPTRIWYVVNRRLLVDAAWDHGRDLAAMLAAPDLVPPGARREAAAQVASALRSITALGSVHGPLHVTRLRGGAESGDRVPDPSQPVIVFSTVPMFASRLMFRGYGSSTSMRPVDAALAGIDSLVLLDEAHLARNLVRLMRHAAQCDIGDPANVLPAPRARPRLVAITATGEGGADRFDLDDDDRSHPVIRRRLGAPKPTRLLEVKHNHLARALATEALALLRSRAEASVCVVFTNTPRLAREVEHHVRSLGVDGRGPDVLLVTGRVREWDADALRCSVTDPQQGAPSGRDPLVPRQRDLLMVATQTLEVGADLDFDFLVTEAAGVRALTQRFGRLNRLGERPWARGVILFAPDAKSRPVYGAEVDELWQRLDHSAELDLGPQHIGSVLGDPHDATARTGELLPEHLWEWAKTSVPPVGEAPVSVFFEGFEDDGPQVSLCWREFVPDPGRRLQPPPRRVETIEVPLWEVRAALDDRGIDTLARLGDDGATVEIVARSDLRPGDTVILDAGVGMYDRFGWDPLARDPVPDFSPFASDEFVLHPAVVEQLVEQPDARARACELVRLLCSDPADEDGDPDLRRVYAAELRTVVVGQRRPSTVPEAVWDSFTERLTDEVHYPIDGEPFLVIRAAQRRQRTASVRADAFDELSLGFDARAVTLAEHLGSVGECAERIAGAIGVPQDLREAVRRAGALHDLGKADLRFQRWLDPQASHSVPVAKSGLARSSWEWARRASGWPRGGRHEVLSARLVEAWLREGGDLGSHADLVMHLVVSHHGHGRPSMPVVDDESAGKVECEIDGVPVVVSGDLSEVDWAQPLRFRALCERYGYWGLALLEAVVRQSDQAVSGAVEVV